MVSYRRLVAGCVYSIVNVTCLFDLRHRYFHLLRSCWRSSDRLTEHSWSRQLIIAVLGRPNFLLQSVTTMLTSGGSSMVLLMAIEEATGDATLSRMIVMRIRLRALGLGLAIEQTVAN